MFVPFPDDGRWNAERQAVEFGVEVGEYSGVVRVPRRVFQRLLRERPTPEKCVEAYYLRRTPEAPTPADPERECGDRRKGLALVLRRTHRARARHRSRSGRKQR